MVFNSIFNSREEALLLWLGIIFILILSKKGTRESVINLAKVLSNKKLIFVFSLMTLYVCAELLLLNRINFIDKSLIKDVIFWFLGSALVILVNINKASSEKKFFRMMMFDNLKFVAVLEFIINFYTFNFFIEMVLVPLIFFLMAISVIAGMEKKFSLVKKIANVILAIIGTIIVVYAFVGLISHYSDLASIDNLRAFILSPALTILYIPFIYFLALFMAYEILFVRLDSLLHHNKSLITPVKKKIILSFHIKLKKLNQFSNNCAKEFLKVQNEKDVDDFFATLK